MDRLRPGKLTASLGASGLIMSRTRFLGYAASGGRIYTTCCPPSTCSHSGWHRCLPRNQRLIEQELETLLRSEYCHAALCIEVLCGNTGTIGIQGCAAATGTPDALLYASGTPGFGLVPNGVSAVTV